jgi:Thiamine-binding protein
VNSAEHAPHNTMRDPREIARFYDRGERPATASAAALGRRFAERVQAPASRSSVVEGYACSLEGSTEDILSLVAELHSVPFDRGIPRVYTVLKLDERRDRPDQTLEDKVRAVEERLAADAS